MKVLAIGDPHGNLEKISNISLKGISLVLITGDLGEADLARKRFFENSRRKKEGLPELKEDAKFEKAVYNQIHNSTIKVLKHFPRSVPVYTIQGNVGIYTDSEINKKNEKHGFNLKSTTGEIKKLGNISLAKNQIRIINGVRIGFLEYFTDVSWVKEFKPKDYGKYMRRAQKQTEKARRVLERFGDLEILVCHQPPYGFLDTVNFPGVPKDWIGKHAGSKAIRDYIKRRQPNYVFCGHIHEGEGKAEIGKTKVYNLGVGGYRIVDFHPD